MKQGYLITRKVDHEERASLLPIFSVRQVILKIPQVSRPALILETGFFFAICGFAENFETLDPLSISVQ
jgi:hypothetical protein